MRLRPSNNFNLTFLIMMKGSPNKKIINKDVKNSISLLLLPDSELQPGKEQNPQQKTLHFSAETIKKELEILCWRYKTYLPIVKPLEYLSDQIPKSSGTSQPFAKPGPEQSKMRGSWLQQNQGMPARHSVCQPMEDGPCELQVQMEEIRCRLSDIDLLSFSQILYLLKEMMIGYDALIDIFGVFDIRPEMVAVSINYQWKVWMHEDFFRNTKEEPKGAIGEREFIYRLLLLSEKHCQSTSLSKIFFKEMKEYTYNNDCGFIHMLESIKEFIKVNKIFQVNKVTLPNDKNFNLDISNHVSGSGNNLPSSKIKSATSLNATSCFGTASRAGGQKMGMDKKKSMMVNSSTDHFRPNINRTSGVPFPQMANNVSQIIDKKPGSQLQHAKSQKFINSSAMFYYPPQSPMSPVVGVRSPKAGFGEVSDKFNTSLGMQHRSPPQQLQKPPVFEKEPSPCKEKKVLTKFLKGSSLLQSIKTSAIQADKKTTSFAQLTKSRHELKQLISPKHPNALAVPAQPRKNRRKYSEQLFKGKSVDLLTGVNKVRCSQFYDLDPEVKQHQQVNVIYKSGQKGDPVSPKSPVGGIKHYPSSKKTMVNVNDPGSSTPNNSSSNPNNSISTPNNSINSMNSTDKSKDKRTSYQYLKVNDLQPTKLRNNQSSYYGMGGGGYPEARRDKNMTISYEFKNRNEARSKSSHSSEKNNNEHNWTKKISGLFSDQTSIKQLKKSVKFKTAEEEYFEKEYLKDVKLDMLEKFGRQVRYSIVDEDDEEDDQGDRSHYESMQLIEEVAEEGKSFIEKEELVEEEEGIRGRTRTVQVGTVGGLHSQLPSKIEQRECVSYQASSNSNSEIDSDGFNFESEEYVLN